MEFFWLVWPRSKLPGFEGITATEGHCSGVALLFLLELLQERFAQTKAALLISQGLRHVKLRLLRLA